MQAILQKSIREIDLSLKELKKAETLLFLEQAAELIARQIRAGKKILLIGNGGSLCDAMHFAEELTGKFRHSRPPLPAIALSDPAHMTCVANDWSFEKVFSRYIEALGTEGDILIVLSTSGQSPNIIEALHTAKEKKLLPILFLGKNGGQAKGMAELEWIVEGNFFSDRVQEIHIKGIHLLIELIESILF